MLFRSVEVIPSKLFIMQVKRYQAMAKGKTRTTTNENRGIMVVGKVKRDRREEDQNGKIYYTPKHENIISILTQKTGGIVRPRKLARMLTSGQWASNMEKSRIYKDMHDHMEFFPGSKVGGMKRKPRPQTRTLRPEMNEPMSVISLDK